MLAYLGRNTETKAMSRKGFTATHLLHAEVTILLSKELTSCFFVEVSYEERMDTVTRIQ